MNATQQRDHRTVTHALDERLSNIEDVVAAALPVLRRAIEDEGAKRQKGEAQFAMLRVEYDIRRDEMNTESDRRLHMRLNEVEDLCAEIRRAVDANGQRILGDFTATLRESWQRTLWQRLRWICNGR